VHILVINSGSSSIKFSLFEAGGDEARSLFEGEVTGIGGAQGGFKFRDAGGRDLSGGRSEVEAKTPVQAIGLVVGAVSGEGLPRVDAVGYRVVHPGAKLDRHQRITDEVLKDLEEAVVFAPLHDPAVIVRVCRTTLASIRCFIRRCRRRQRRIRFRWNIVSGEFAGMGFMV